jgi:hypothetical protein
MELGNAYRVADELGRAADALGRELPSLGIPGPRQSPEGLSLPASWRTSCFCVGVELASTQAEASSAPIREPT